jgi:hypothetical protein
LQFLIGLFQIFQLSTTEKRTDTACYGSSYISGCAFEFVGAYLRFHLFEFLLGKIYLVFLVQSLSLDAFKFCALLLE